MRQPPKKIFAFPARRKKKLYNEKKKKTEKKILELNRERGDLNHRPSE